VTLREASTQCPSRLTHINHEDIKIGDVRTKIPRGNLLNTSQTHYCFSQFPWEFLPRKGNPGLWYSRTVCVCVFCEHHSNPLFKSYLFPQDSQLQTKAFEINLNSSLFRHVSKFTLTFSWYVYISTKETRSMLHFMIAQNSRTFFFNL
jgi:hypothetical protein